MRTKTAQEIRTAFFDFFRLKGHRIVPSAPMVIKDDPTLMFTNAGMNQFKDIFLGNKAVTHPRVANTQKCLRVSGKHNDLEEVGHDTYHHTMFEMLGNWSFGDYFKKEAIEWAWEFLTEVIGLPKERLYATIFEGSLKENISRDDEAYGYWLACFPQPENRILEGSKKDNFWEMGDTGPCGPCSEIHIDLRSEAERAKVAGHTLVNTGHPLVVEIWNLVFIQYNRRSGGELELLPARHVDTGMGFERLCMAVQGKQSNYDTDVFSLIINKISEITGIGYGSGNKSDIAMRVVSDHLRAVSFSIADGQIPSNNKAGYVIRRILRRAVRYGYNDLGMEEPFIFKLVPVLTEAMGNTFPELVAGHEHIAGVIHDEEAAFLRTLGKGQRLMEKEIEQLRKTGAKVLPGSVAFELYDTYGFPLDLTQLILRENEMEADTAGFEKCMKSQRERSREDAVVDAGDWTVIADSEETVFTGYETTVEKVRIMKYRKIRVRNKDRYQLVFDRTPFYAEAGGQAGDTGTLTSGSETIRITDTLRENNLIIHITDKLPSDPHAEFTAKADEAKRLLTENNHTATHLLHHALRDVLGSHVEQKGSLVNSERLRFDFSHTSKLSREEIAAIEEKVNLMVGQNINRDTHNDIPMEEARKMGAMALFGEKYGDTVRVVQFGQSVELCGGTHVTNTARIGLFKIVSETAIAAGIRRIEAITGKTALDYVNRKLIVLDEVAEIIHSTGDVADAASRLVGENARLKKSVEKLQLQMAAVIADKLKSSAVAISSPDAGNVKFIAANSGSENTELLKSAAGIIRNNSDNTILILGTSDSGKATLIVMVSDKLAGTGKIDAVRIIKDIAVEIGGSGGGQPFLAVAGGKNPAGIDKALEKAVKFVRSTLL
ncbi:MAG: alanine--tRNA ligase [Bacteroidales bacterium]